VISARKCGDTRLQHFDYTYDETTTTNAYVAFETFDLRGRMNCAVRLENTHGANSIDYKILGSIDGANFDITVKSETSVAAAGVEIVNKSSTAYIPYLAIYIKSTVADAAGTVIVTVCCV
jgi:hypothetical protein